MPYVIRALFVLLCLIPATALAEYDQALMKKGFTELFKVDNWKMSDNGAAWVSTGRKDGVVLSVSAQNAGMIGIPENTGKQGMYLLVGCIAIAEIGLKPETEKQRTKISNTIQAALNSQSKKSITMNGVRFEANLTEVFGNAVLSCDLSPAPRKK